MSEETIEIKDDNTKINKKESLEDSHAKLTLYVRGLPFEATSKDLEDFFGEIGPIRKCFVVADKSTTTKDQEENEAQSSFRNKGFGYVHYALEDDAQAAITRLKNVKFMGRKLKIEFAKRKSETVREDTKKVEEPKKRAEPLNFDVNARLIVRNLPWKYRETDLRKLFEKYGKVHEVKLPRKYEGGPLRGFAFIQFENTDEGKAAMDALNATEHHGRTIAVDWSIPKVQYKQMEENEVNETDAQTENTSDNDDDMKEINEEEESASDKMEIDNEDAESEDVETEESEDDEEDKESNDESDIEDEKSNEQKANKDKPTKKTGPSIKDGTTLFIRNLLFESTEEDLKELFKQWGPVVYAKITRDPDTKLSRGTGFVCMRKKEDVDRILEAAESVRALSQKDENNEKEAIHQLLSKREKKKKGLLYKSIITAEPGSGEAAKFTLHGRVLDVTLAVDREEAKKIKDSNLAQKHKEDKRNLYLMREGVIFPDTPAADTLTPSELTKRQMSFSTRKKLVSNNPSLFISKTRLSIRNLPTKVDEKELKALGISSIAKFKNQVKAGEREDLSKQEKEEGWQYLPKVKQAKIIRSKDRIDSTTNQLRSKGYGFLEFSTHAHALAALRYLNNNPDIFKGKRLIVEFSLENKKVIERRKQKETNGNKVVEQRNQKRKAEEDTKQKKKFKKSNKKSRR